jgi:hypothetical protein
MYFDALFCPFLLALKPWNVLISDNAPSDAIEGEDLDFR